MLLKSVTWSGPKWHFGDIWWLSSISESLPCCFKNDHGEQGWMLISAPSHGGMSIVHVCTTNQNKHLAKCEALKGVKSHFAESSCRFCYDRNVMVTKNSGDIMTLHYSEIHKMWMPGNNHYTIYTKKTDFTSKATHWCSLPGTHTPSPHCFARSNPEILFKNGLKYNVSCFHFCIVILFQSNHQHFFSLSSFL